MSMKRTLGAASAAAALICLSGAAYAGQSGGGNGYIHKGKDKVEIYISVKSGAKAKVAYDEVLHAEAINGFTGGIWTPSQPIDYEKAVVWGKIKKVKIEAQGDTSGTFDVGYSSDASTHSKSATGGGQQGGPTVASTSEPGGCGCTSTRSSSTTSASTEGHASGGWSTGSGSGGSGSGGGSGGGGSGDDD
jgi:hypothetical protein